MLDTVEQLVRVAIATTDVKKIFFILSLFVSINQKLYQNYSTEIVKLPTWFPLAILLLPISNQTSPFLGIL